MLGIFRSLDASMVMKINVTNDDKGCVLASGCGDGWGL